MRLEILQPVAGRRWAYPAGVHDVPEEIAQLLLDAGHARKVSKGGKKKAEVKDERSHDVE
jgi:hypothetical protein